MAALLSDNCTEVVLYREERDAVVTATFTVSHPLFSAYVFVFQSIRTRAVLSDDGRHYILNGGKIW